MNQIGKKFSNIKTIMPLMIKHNELGLYLKNYFFRGISSLRLASDTVVNKVYIRIDSTLKIFLWLRKLAINSALIIGSLSKKQNIAGNLFKFASMSIGFCFV